MIILAKAIFSKYERVKIGAVSSFYKTEWNEFGGMTQYTYFGCKSFSNFNILQVL